MQETLLMSGKGMKATKKVAPETWHLYKMLMPPSCVYGTIYPYVNRSVVSVLILNIFITRMALLSPSFIIVFAVDISMCVL